MKPPPPTLPAFEYGAKKRSEINCSMCRNAQTQIAGKGFALICTKGLTGEAFDCPEFWGARKPTP